MPANNNICHGVHNVLTVTLKSSCTKESYLNQDLKSAIGGLSFLMFWSLLSDLMLLINENMKTSKDKFNRKILLPMGHLFL